MKKQRSFANVPTARLSAAAALVRRHDRDRYQTALFAPAARREALFALYAFNYEIARVRETVTQPALGLIRLEWWRENIATAYGGGAVRHQPVAEALASLIRERRLTREHFDVLINAREADLDDDRPGTLAALEDYAEATSSRLVYLALEALGIRETAAMTAGRSVGIGFALAGLLRALPIRAAGHRSFIPVEVADRHGLDLGSARPLGGSPALRAVTAEIAALAYARLGQARRVHSAIPRAALPALILAKIAERSLDRLRRASYDPFNPSVRRYNSLQIWRLWTAAVRGRF